MIRVRILVSFIIMLILSVMTYNAYASYSYISATVYADNWALSRNSNYPNFTSDCATLFHNVSMKVEDYHLTIYMIGMFTKI